MAACPLVDLLACAQLVVGMKGEVAEVGPGQLESRSAWGCCFLPSYFGNIKGKLDLLWGCLGVSAEKELVLCTTETSHILCDIDQGTRTRDPCLRTF